MRRVTPGRRGLIALGLGVAVVAVVTAAVLPGLGSGTQALPAPRFVEEAIAAGLRAPLRRRVHVLRRRRRRDLRLRRGWSPGPLHRRGRGARRPVPEREPGRWRAGVHPGAEPRDRPRAGRRRVPARHRRGRGRRPRRPPPRRERPPPGARRLRVRTRERGVGLRRRVVVDRGLQRDLGVSRRSAHAGLRPVPGARIGRGANVRLRRARARPARRRWWRVRAADDAVAGHVYALDAVQRLGPIRPPRLARLERPPLRGQRARSSCGASRRKSRRGSGRARRGGRRCASGAWASPATT